MLSPIDCRNCNAKNQTGRFCSNCGKQLQQDPANLGSCINCGALLNFNSAFCPQCAKPVSSYAAPTLNFAHPVQSSGGNQLKGWSPLRWFLGFPLFMKAMLIVLAAILICGGIIVSLASRPIHMPLNAVNVSSPAVNASQATQGGATLTLTPTQTTAPSPTPTFTPTPGIKIGEVLYKADFKNRPNEWTPGGSWAIGDGQLINSGGQSTDVIAIPVQLTVPDYYVEWTAKIDTSSCRGGLYAQVRADQATQQGYTGGYICWVGLYYLSQSPNLKEPDNTQNPSVGYLISKGYNTFRLAVKGTQVSLYLNGIKYLSEEVTTTFDPGQAFLFDDNSQVEISALQVVAL